jgi:para-aminobenzoate synthetase component 2
MTGAVRVLVVDNRDSFVHNLVHYLRELGATVEVRGNRTFEPHEVYDPRQSGADGVLISPGPGRPEDAGSSLDLIHGCARTGLPLLGVCLGHQAIAYAYGGVVGPAPELIHGGTSEIVHSGAGVLHGLPDRFPATRYHSLAVEEASLPAELEVTARTPDGTVMGLRHRDHALEGVQFHPESVLSEGGHELLRNWLTTCATV